MAQTKNSVASPTLGHIHAITLYLGARNTFADIVESVAGKVAPDAANEQAVLIRNPLPQEYPWNGLVAFEKFGPDQVPHIHFPDPRKRDSSERYILLSPTAGDSSVFIAPPEAPHKGEKIKFDQGNLYLLHFDGGSLHKFTNAYAVAFHTNDVAVTPEALMDQTELHVAGKLPRVPQERIFRSPRDLPFGSPAAIHSLLEATKYALAEGNKYGGVERTLADLALHVVGNGRSYGAPRWASAKTFGEWFNTAQDRDLPPSPKYMADRSLLIPKPEIATIAPPSS